MRLNIFVLMIVHLVIDCPRQCAMRRFVHAIVGCQGPVRGCAGLIKHQEEIGLMCQQWFINAHGENYGDYDRISVQDMLRKTNVASHDFIMDAVNIIQTKTGGIMRTPQGSYYYDTALACFVRIREFLK